MNAPHSTTSARTRDWVRLTKPGIVASNVLTAAAGIWLAPVVVDMSVMVAALVGTGLLVAGSGAFNQLLERDTDAFMERTRSRPLVDGRVHTLEAVILGVLTVAGGCALLATSVNWLTAILGLAATLIYTFVYTPLKRRTFWAVPIGAVAGALPPLMGWAAATGSLDAGAWMLFAILFWWQMPHFLGIALYRAEDYRNAGLRIAPRREQVGLTVHLVRASAVLLVSLALPLVATAGPIYLACALAGALLLARFAFARRGNQPSAQWGRRVFLASLAYLPLFALGALLEALLF